MNLRLLHGKINAGYAWELQSFWKYRGLSDGIDFVEFTIKYDKYICDHNPRFECSLKMFNWIIFGFSVYNVYHTDNPKSPYYGMDDDTEFTIEIDKKEDE